MSNQGGNYDQCRDHEIAQQLPISSCSTNFASYAIQLELALLYKRDFSALVQQRCHPWLTLRVVHNGTTTTEGSVANVDRTIMYR